MSKHWIKQDLIDNESKLNKLITNLDSNSRLCWLFMVTFGLIGILFLKNTNIFFFFFLGKS